MAHLILASTSPHRQKLLRDAGVPFTCEAPQVDERALEETLRAGRPDLSPEDLCRALAEAKARDVLHRHPDAVVLGSDQVLSLGGEVIGKPRDAADAATRLWSLSGRTHRLLTAVALLGGGEDTVFIEETDLTVRALTAAEVEGYVGTGEWQGCAGGYRIEGQGIRLMSRIDGDYHNIIGLPLLAVLRALRERGLA